MLFQERTALERIRRKLPEMPALYDNVLGTYDPQSNSAVLAVLQSLGVVLISEE